MYCFRLLQLYNICTLNSVPIAHLNFNYLQQQKFNISVRHRRYRKANLRIYNSRNLIYLLDSRFEPKYFAIYNSRNLIYLLDTMVYSTVGSYLQQQKFNISVRQYFFGCLLCSIYNSRNLIYLLDSISLDACCSIYNSRNLIYLLDDFPPNPHHNLQQQKFNISVRQQRWRSNDKSTIVEI